MKEDVENKIVVAARIVFFDKGYDGATMRDIAGTAGVNLALLHYYFRTKDKLFEIVFDEAFSLLFKKLNKALSVQNNIFEKIRLMVESYISTAVKYPQLPSFIMHEMSVNPKLIMSVMNNHKEMSKMEHNFEQFEKEIIEAISNKEIKEIDPNDLCIDIQSLCLYPFMAKDFLIEMLNQNKKTYNKMVKNRGEYISEIIIKAIKL